MLRRVAVPIWQGRVSPLMDSARQILVVQLENGRELGRRIELLPQLHPVHLVRFIGGLGVDVVICGSASRQLQSLLEVSGVEVIPWVRGSAEEVVSAYSNGQLQSENFFLPGCRFGRGRGRRGHGRGRGRGPNLGYGATPREDL